MYFYEYVYHIFIKRGQMSLKNTVYYTQMSLTILLLKC